MLAALARYYDQLLETHPEKVARPGWCARKVKFVIQLSSEGSVYSIVRDSEKNGLERVVPEQVKRSSGVSANFLCDNSSYLLGIDAKGKPERSEKCFAAARELHCDILREADSVCARALRLFFETWDVASAREHPAVVAAGDELLAGGNIVFAVTHGGSSESVLDDGEIVEAWDKRSAHSDSDDSPVMCCLVTGEKGPIARLHPIIQGVYGAQSSGASLVGFNSRAFESYGHEEEQGRNAPVSIRASRAYSTALNYLLKDRNHHTRLGDTTLVYWAERSDDENSELFGIALGDPGGEGASNVELTEKSLHETLQSVAEGKHRARPELDTTFYVAGLAPNAARLSVRFFFKDNFGDILENIAQHYRRIAIAHHPQDREYLTPYQLLHSLENPNAKKPTVMSVLSEPLMRAILFNARYPEAAYMQALQRTFSSQDNEDKRTKKVSRARVALIKACLLRNYGYDEEEVTVDLNEERNSTAYALGRTFALLEQIQETANKSSNISGRYFNSACATPGVAFPALLRLTSAHLQKIGRDNPGLAHYFRAQLAGMIKEDRVSAFPKRLSSAEQGNFLLGYWHQQQKRYEKTEKVGSDSSDQVQSDQPSDV